MEFNIYSIELLQIMILIILLQIILIQTHIKKLETSKVLNIYQEMVGLITHKELLKNYSMNGYVKENLEGDDGELTQDLHYGLNMVKMV
nr:MAG TPA: hypothetical protein [Caudoviricetes sp.]